jgi:hypothetical protein
VRAAHSEYAAADRVASLADDLERFATAAFLIGREAESVDTLSRAHHGFMNRGNARARRVWHAQGLRMV